MKILHLIASTGIGGAERHVVDLCRTQREAGLQVCVALPKQGALGAELERLGIEQVRVISGGRWNPLALLSLHRVIRDVGADLVHAHMPKSAFMAGWATFRVPCVATAHNMVKHLAPFRHCRQVICVSDMVYQSMRRLGYPANRLHVVHNAIDTSRFGTNDRDAVRHRMGWHDRFVTLCVARLVPAKGQQDAIVALAQLLARLPAALLVLVGDGPDRNKLVALANNLGVGDNVLFLGDRHDVPDLLAGSDIYLQPSIKEGFGIAFLEAMSTGLACVGTATGAIPEMVESGVNGLIVPVSDINALENAIFDLASQSAARERMAAAAKMTAQTRFSLVRQAQDTLEVYLRAVKRP